MLLGRLNGLVLQRPEGRWVVGIRAMVAIHAHCAVTVEGRECAQGAVDGNGLIVRRAEAVTVGVRVREEAGLEDGIGGGLDAGDKVGG